MYYIAAYLMDSYRSFHLILQDFPIIKHARLQSESVLFVVDAILDENSEAEEFEKFDDGL